MGRRRRLVLRLALVAAALLVAGGIALAVPVLWPTVDEPVRAEAIVVLSGDHGERLGRAKELVAAGVAPTLVLVGTPDLVEHVAMCAGRTHFDAVCLRPAPDNTRTEAVATAELAGSRGWRTLVVVTSTPHVARARLLFDRCFSGTVHVVGARAPTGAYALWRARIHEWFGLAHALAFRRC